MLIYVTEEKDIAKVAIDLLKQNGHTIITTKPSPENGKNIEAVFIRTYTIISKEFLAHFPNVKFILRAGVGLDNIDLKLCRRNNINIFNAPGSNSNAVAEFIIGIIFMLLRNINQQSKLINSDGWRKRVYVGEELIGKTIGLVGCGAIGKLLAQKLHTLGVKSILGYDPYLERETLSKNCILKTELNDVIVQSDIISLHLPLTSETRNLISLNQLKKMKTSSYIINTSRGGIVNEDDLIHALSTNLIKGAALDVFENEPKINKSLLEIENLILTPHIAGYTKEADEKMSLIAAEKFLTYLKEH